MITTERRHTFVHDIQLILIRYIKVNVPISLFFLQQKHDDVRRYNV